MAPLFGAPARRWLPVVLLIETAALVAMAVFLHRHPHATGIDRSLQRWTAPAPGGDVHDVANAVTVLGFVPVALAVAVLFAAWIWRKRDRALALACLVAPVLAVFAELGLKRLVGRPGLSPDQHISEPGYSLLDRLFHSSQYSFPSGHATVITAVAVAACVVVWRSTRSRGWRFTSLVVAVVVTAAVGTSRMILQAHVASDVAGGLLVGSTEALAVVAFADWLRPVPASADAGTGRRSRPREN